MVREIEEELSYRVASFESLGSFVAPLPDGTLAERHIFVSPLPAYSESVFEQHEGQGRELFSLARARKSRMVPGDETVLDMVEAHLSRMPFVFVSCSLSHAPMEFVRDMLAFQGSLADICRTNSWSVDVTARPETNESADLASSIFAHDTAGVRRADAMVAEVSYPSTGSGVELGIAAERGIPILLLARAGSRVSPFVRGIPGAVYREYTDPNEPIDLVRTELLSRLSRP